MQTPCPHCGGLIAVDGPATCAHCGGAVAFVDVPDRPCDACGGPVPLIAATTTRCQKCGKVHPTDARRRVRHVAQCPRCRRDVEVAADAKRHDCPHCGEAMVLQDTL